MAIRKTQVHSPPSIGRVGALEQQGKGTGSLLAAGRNLFEKLAAIRGAPKGVPKTPVGLGLSVMAALAQVLSARKSSLAQRQQVDAGASTTTTASKGPTLSPATQNVIAQMMKDRPNLGSAEQVAHLRGAGGAFKPEDSDENRMVLAFKRSESVRDLIGASGHFKPENDDELGRIQAFLLEEAADKLIGASGGFKPEDPTEAAIVADYKRFTGQG
jgi:hypothetical protein